MPLVLSHLNLQADNIRNLHIRPALPAQKKSVQP
jgi:hypothetical protein